MSRYQITTYVNGDYYILYDVDLHSCIGKTIPYCGTIHSMDIDFFRVRTFSNAETIQNFVKDFLHE